MSTADLKKELRAQVRDRRAGLTDVERRERSRRAHHALTSSSRWIDAAAVGLFCSMAEEIDTRALIRAAWESGKRVALPFTPPLGEPLEFMWVTEQDRLIRNVYGVEEPGPGTERATTADLDLLVVPGLAFDARGARLGYGGGYYDRTLDGAVFSVLLAFGCQQVEQVPEGPHDKCVDAVVTEEGWVLGRDAEPSPP